MGYHLHAKYLIKFEKVAATSRNHCEPDACVAIAIIAIIIIALDRTTFTHT